MSEIHNGGLGYSREIEKLKKQRRVRVCQIQLNRNRRTGVQPLKAVAQPRDRIHLISPAVDKIVPKMSVCNTNSNTEKITNATAVAIFSSQYS